MNTGQEPVRAPPTAVITTTVPVVIARPRPAFRDKTERIAVPAMPMPAAVICCILNFLLPGFGTICAGFSAFCCSRNEDIDRSGRCVSCMLNFGMGSAQFITCFLCFIGWFWSCTWGVFFIGMSAEYYHNNRIAADGGYIHRVPRQTGIVITTQPEQPTASSTQLHVHPPVYSTLPPEQQKTAGTTPDTSQEPPPPYPY